MCSNFLTNSNKLISSLLTSKVSVDAVGHSQVIVAKLGYAIGYCFKQIRTDTLTLKLSNLVLYMVVRLRPYTVLVFHSGNELGLSLSAVGASTLADGKNGPPMTAGVVRRLSVASCRVVSLGCNVW